MKLSRNRVLLSVVLMLLGCSNAESAGTASIEGGCVSPSCQAAAGADAKTTYVLEVDAGVGGASAGSGDAAVPVVFSACNVVALGCNPDDVDACVGQGAATSGGAGGTRATGAGSGGAMHPMACRITITDSLARSQCDEAGAGVDGESCSSGADCAPGNGCVNENGSAFCRPYCCSSDSACSSGSYCGKRELAGIVDTSATYNVMVCLPAVSCSFDELYPCPADQTCSCPTGTTCGVVRADGMTACVIPGTGLEGDACPCAAGHVCSDATGACMKTCKLTNSIESAEACADGVCQGTTSLPEGVGICVSTVALS